MACMVDTAMCKHKCLLLRGCFDLIIGPGPVMTQRNMLSGRGDSAEDQAGPSPRVEPEVLE